MYLILAEWRSSGSAELAAELGALEPWGLLKTYGFKCKTFIHPFFPSL